MADRFDVAVIGGGIVGLAHALAAARRKHRVLLVERSHTQQGATVRNFGMIWPIGQPAGRLHDTAMRSREIWCELADAGAVHIDQCGSIHLAHCDDERQVLQEFCELGTHATQWLSAEEVLRRAPLVQPNGLLGGMFSETEMRVDPRTAATNITRWLEQDRGVCVQMQTTITEIRDHQLISSRGRRWTADRIVVCSGSDLQTLYPEALDASGLKRCKLQMLMAKQHSAATIMPHIASGLTLRHYQSFNACPSHAALKQRIAAATPELDQYGIHVMASAFNDGPIILGDSHEYEEQISPFDSTEIDELILRELRKVIRLDDWTITQRWSGIYTKHPDQPVFEAEVDDGVCVFVGTGGAGMTMAFGLADAAWS